MRVLIIGGGGREHALAWKIAQSPHVSKIFVAPGNAGTARETGVENVAIAAEDVAALVNFARDHTIDLTIVGPEAPLALGVVDAFTAAGLRCFGPTRVAAQLESSKAYAKDFLARHKIPTAAYRTFTAAAAAIAYVRAAGTPIVIKADGLAAGKGVVIAQNEAEAVTAITDMLSGNGMGDAGRRVVIEEFLRGEEASFIVMVDGVHSLPLATAQDHKARDDGDRGPNTGGMGAYSPAPVVTPEIHARIMREVIAPTVRGMAAEGAPYTGFLYAGLMIAPDGSLRVLEFNCRLGDPETQPILMRLRSDLAELCNAALDKRLHEMNAEWDARAALGVVLAAGGYPGSYRSGDVIHGLEQTPPADSKVFHAGTRLGNLEGEVVTAGGRVLCACALGDTVGSAQRRAYELVQSIRWRDLYYRTDIGHRAIARETAN
ncbi:MAG: phosphoribosylamine--glycine ligase [Gammaproteobacteria bacterium]|nr:phosphoribosylamine--glycine ligase [Gammaproteobacteria bacterium]